MANRYGAKYIVVDTTDTQLGGQNPAGGNKGNLLIKAIKWVGTQNAGKDIAQNDDLTIEIPDTNGDKVIEVRAQESTPYQIGYSIEFAEAWIVSGLYVEDIDGGELQIFLE